MDLTANIHSSVMQPYEYGEEVGLENKGEAQVNALNVYQTSDYSGADEANGYVKKQRYSRKNSRRQRTKRGFKSEDDIDPQS